MKNLCLFATIALFSVVSAQAQNPTDLIQFGVKGGLNISTVTGDGFESPDARTSFYFGGAVEIPFSDGFSIQPEILYSAQGFDVTGHPIMGAEYSAQYQLGYIQIPVLAKIYLMDGLNLQVGPQIGFLVNEEIDFQPVNDDGDVPLPEEQGTFQDIGMAIAAGLGYKFDSGFFIQGRYTYGFTDSMEDTDIHNSVIQLGVGYMF